ncbi:hypothetical protein QBC44DRAFT_85095 [Cladorrhinum sp. PSN332]|nr:hypothetical protein QBC44DRAFT_85095 [Cladorrhinum sp. PSN332]
MLRKKDTFTVITPIPGFIPRQLAIDILHSHSEVITLNPLVIEHKPIAAPQNAATDEYYSTWYEITERVQVVPGMGKMGSSLIKFNGCFHDMPWGLQTHVYAPMNIDMRSTYRVAGNQPGFEAPEVPEIGLKALGAPSDGLYLREDIEIRCNITMMSFVKSQAKKACADMVARIIKKAELLDAGALSAMIEDGKLKTMNPADRRNTMMSGLKSPIPSPTAPNYSPSINDTSPPQMHSPRMPYQIPRMHSVNRPGTAGSTGPEGYNSPPPQPYQQPYPQQYQQPYPQPYQHQFQPQQQYGYQHAQSDGPQELMASEPANTNQFAAEMPGDYTFASNGNGQTPQIPQPTLLTPQGTPQQPDRESLVDPNQQGQGSPRQGQWGNANSRPTSTSSSITTPNHDNKYAYPAPLASHKETKEEYDRKQQPQYSAYNPADYAKVPPQQNGHSPQYGHGQLGQRYNYTQ